MAPAGGKRSAAPPGAASGPADVDSTALPEPPTPENSVPETTSPDASFDDAGQLNLYPTAPLRGHLILPALALAAGIATANRLALPTAVAIIPPFMALLIFVGLTLRSTGFFLRRLARHYHGAPEALSQLWKVKPARLLALLLLPIFFLAGYNLAWPQLTPPSSPTHLYNLLASHKAGEPAAMANHDVVLTGVVQELPRQSGDRYRLVLAADELHRPGEKIPAHGLIQLTLNGRPNSQLQPGDSLIARARAGPVRSFAVPGAFDYQKFLAHRGIHVSGWVASPIQLAHLREPATESIGHRLTYLPERLRHGAGQLLDRYLAEEKNLPVLRALLIGDRSGIEADTMEAFKAGGAMHLLAISGMHLGLIALLSIAALEWLLKRSPNLMQTIYVRKAALLLALFPIIGYALITGLQPPAMRALIMTLVFIAAVLCNRQWCNLNNLALAALIILVLEPPALFGASFQLSFAATAGIIMLAPALHSQYQAATTLPRRLIFWIMTSLLVSTVATLVTAPLAMHHFHRVSLLSPLTTLLATPLLFFWTLPLALSGLLLAAISELPALTATAGVLLTAAVRGLDATVALTTRLAELPYSFFYLSPPSMAEFFCWGVLFAALALIRRHMIFPATAAVMVLLLLLLPVHKQWQRLQEDHSRVSFIEVGHGNATVVELPGNRTVLVDGGGPGTLSTNVGEQLIAPFLRRQRIRNLEAVVISHPHADHYNGIGFLLRHFQPQTLWINGRSQAAAADYQNLLDLAEELDITVEVPDKSGELLVTAPKNDNGDRVVRLKNFADFHLRAPADFNPPLPDPVNDQSLVIGYRHGNFSFLLPGDIGMDQERRLIEQYGDNFRHQVLAASHHGRWTSMAPEFISATDPDYIVVSDNEQRVDRQRLSTWQKRGHTVLTTGRHGTIICTTNGRHLQCRPTRH